MTAPFSKRAQPWEPTALRLRQLLALSADAPLDPWTLAPKVGLTVVDGNVALQGLTLAERNHLSGLARRLWSGGVYPHPLPDGSYLCILNPQHSHERNKITLMEEISHIHLGHKPSELVLNENGVRVRGFDKPQEDEAYGVGAAALLPWPPFFRSLNVGRTVDELADHYEVTPELIQYRIKITGAYNLFRARQRSRVQARG